MPMLLHQKKKHYRIKKIMVAIVLMLLVGATMATVVGSSALQAEKDVYMAANTSLQLPPISSATVVKILAPSSSEVSFRPSSEVSFRPSSEVSSKCSSVLVSSKSSLLSSSPKPQEVKVSSSPISSEISVSAEPIPPEEASSDIAAVIEYTDGELPQGSLTDWNLILLNHGENNKIDKELDITKVKFDSQYIDERASEAYKNMYAAAQEANITLFLRSGYRSMKTQQINYNANVQRELNRGNNKADAIRLTNLYYTVPGHSEHHSGLAFDLLTPQYHKDIYSLDERFAATDAYTWLTANCAQYGFILRYPKDKTDITNINFEPWHYRYVGVEHAKYITENALCLEEYIALLAEREAQ